MNQRPQRNEYGDYHERYISLVPAEGDLTALLKQQTESMVSLFSGLGEEQGAYRYAPEKWSIKEVIGHLTDNDRIMSYRLLRIARGDSTPLPGYEEDLFVAEGAFDRFTLQEVIHHYAAVRASTLALFASLSEEAWLRTGTASGTGISARAQACLILGHELHHLNILKERYLTV